MPGSAASKKRLRRDPPLLHTAHGVATLSDSNEARTALAEAKKMAAKSARAVNSSDVLLALFRFPNRARVVLMERHVGQLQLQRAILPHDNAMEPREMVERLVGRAREVAHSSGAQEMDCLHLLVAISRMRQLCAYRVIERAGHSWTGLRNAAVSYISGAMPRRFVGLTHDNEASRHSRGLAPESSPSRYVLAQKQELEAHHLDSHMATLVPIPSPPEVPSSRLPSKQASAHHEIPIAKTPHLSADRRQNLHFEQHLLLDDHRASQGDEPLLQDDEDLAPHGQGALSAAVLRESEALHLGDEDCDDGHDDNEGYDPAEVHHDHTDPLKVDGRITAKSDFVALEDIAPNLAACGFDLTARARTGRLDRAIGREKELEALADILGKRRANNPVLVGPAGVGKTAIVEGLALMWAGQDPLLPHTYDSRRIVALDTGAIVAGTSLRGSFSERLGAIKAEVMAAQGQLVVFIDELHTLLGVGGSSEGGQDAAGELKTALARGEFPCIGATTTAEFRRYIERDPALERRFTAVNIEEPSCERAKEIIKGAIAPYETHHQVTYAADALSCAVDLTHRFVHERKLPDKALAVLDLAGSRAKRRDLPKVLRHDVATVVHEWTGVPLERLIQSDATRFARTESYLSERLIGHSHVISALASVLRRGFAGLNERRPMGTLLFLGPTGVGKTETVKILAELVFGQRDALVRIDMSELVEKHAVARLLGAQPGYIGYEDGGQLTEAVRRRPFQIVLFDEIDKAHPDVLGVLLQLLDEGHVTDTQGRQVSFSDTLVIMTSNAGSHIFAADTDQTLSQKSLTSTASQRIRDEVKAAAKSSVAPELWGRIDEHLVFLPLNGQEIERIAHLQLQLKRERLLVERGIDLMWNDDVVSFLLSCGNFSAHTGARGLRKVMQDHIDDPMAHMILQGELAQPARLSLRRNARADGLLLTRHELHKRPGMHQARP